MEPSSHPERQGILARQVPASIRLLRKLGVPGLLLAHLFRESADNIRHIDSRTYDEARAAGPIPLPFEDLALLRLTPEDRQAKVRREMRAIRLRTKTDLAQAEAAVWAVFRNHQSVGLAEGYEALLKMRPGVANARHGPALKVRLLIEEKLAWFALPSRQPRVALNHAREAMRCAYDAFQESAGEKSYLFRYGEAALIASICLQKMHQPEQALSFIDAADQANLAAGVLPGSEHLRQRGASFVQLGKDWDERAAKQFERAPKRMMRRKEAGHDIDLAMIGPRQQSFLNPATGWDQVLELAAQVKGMYGSESLQYGVAAKSAAVVGLKFGSAESIATALQLLRAISPGNESVEFPHILSITPELKLSPDDLDRWLRFAMNETPRRGRKTS
jgi:hypothetical protein